MNLFNLDDEKTNELMGLLGGAAQGFGRAGVSGGNGWNGLALAGGLGAQGMQNAAVVNEQQQSRQLQQAQALRKLQQDNMLRAAYGLPEIPIPGLPGASAPGRTPAASPAGGSPATDTSPQSPGSALPIRPNTILDMVPETMRPPLLAMLAANPEKGHDAVMDLMKKQLEMGRWVVEGEGPNRVLRDSFTNKHAAYPDTEAGRVRVAEAGKSSTTVKVDMAGNTELAQLGAKRFNELSSGVPGLQAEQGRLNLIDEALKSYNTGFAGETGLKLKQALAAAGVKTNASEGEFLDSLFKQMQIGAQPQGQGAVSNFERELFAAAAPSLGKTREGNQMLIAVKRAMIQREIDAAKIYEEEVRKNRGNMGTAHLDAMARIHALGPVMSPEVSARFRGAAGGGAAPTDGGVKIMKLE